MAEKQDTCVSLGTPIDAKESALLSRKQKLTSRAPRVWEQIVTDERGRRRLHGAFTGGFSAGYFNTVDTKEGFVPKSFRTSRSRRAEEHTQAVQDFYDKDELEELANVNITTQDVYDTFASARNERVRERTEREATSRPIIPGDIISEFVEGVPDSIGVQLLQKMGWRQGKGIGEAFQFAMEERSGSKWGPEATLSQQKSYAWQEKPKMNVQGLGFDPFRGSRSFAEHKTKASSPRPSSKRSRGIAFGVGVLEETDTFGEIGDYVEAAQDHINYYDMSDHSDDGPRTKQTERRQKRIGHKSSEEKESFVPGFHLGSVLQEKKGFQLPVVPPHFVEKHHDSGMQASTERKKPSQLNVPAPQIPSDEKLKRSIDSVAVFVAKGGVMSEELVRQEHTGDEAFSFLFGGEGSEYYRWKLLDVKVTFQKLGVDCLGVREAPLTADDRGFLLGDERMKEQPTASRSVSHPFIQSVPEADRNRVQSALKATFVKGSTEATLHVDESQPGLRRARPKEAKTAATEPVQRKPQPAELTPVRSFVDWHPIPLLYKRFNILDPLKGMPQEAQPKSRFMSYESGLDDVKTEELQTSADQPPTMSIADEVDITLPPPEYTEPPLDIFKSIFDASDEEEDAKSEPSDDEKQEEKADAPESIKDESPARSPVERKRLNLSSDESEKEEPRHSRKERKQWRKSKSEDFDEEIFSGLSTSEFKKLLKTLKKGRAKKKAKKEAKRKKRREKDQQSKE